jgi:nucleoid-associated protein YgaU
MSYRRTPESYYRVFASHDGSAQRKRCDDCISGARTLRFHRVEPGETLADIAERLYGDASFWAVLYGANQLLLHESDGLRPGQTLFVPFL